jgi:glyoxylase-like metal-dependent hydrolase (beta-lactamase superfamily II)
MIVKTFVLTPFQQNTRLLVCEKTGKAVCVDPGEASAELNCFITENGLELEFIALTHGHLDHVGGVKALKEAFPHVEVILHKGDEPLYYGLPEQPLRMGMPPWQLEALGLVYDAPPDLDRNWSDGEVFEVGEMRFGILHCPGHTPGHVVLAEETARKVFVGDCLFAGSVGRTDLPGGSHEQLIDSIKRKIFPLGDDFIVYSGHGPETTVGQERRTNPFLK